MNPFLSSFTTPVLKKKTIKVEIIESNGAAEIERTTTSIKPVELQSFSKLYHIKDYSGLLMELSPMACKLLLHVQSILERDIDYVKLKLDIICKQLGMSKPTLIAAIRSLVDCGVITKKCQSEYWINPKILFKGDRLTYLKNNSSSCIEYVEDFKPTVIKLGEINTTKVIV